MRRTHLIVLQVGAGIYLLEGCLTDNLQGQAGSKRSVKLIRPCFAPVSTSLEGFYVGALPSMAPCGVPPDNATLGARVDLAAGPHGDEGGLLCLVFRPRRAGAVLVMRGRSVRQAAPHAQLLLRRPLWVILQRGGMDEVHGICL